MAYSASTQGFSTSGGPSFAQTSDSANGTTHAAVSPGTITVKSDQQSGTDSTAGLSRDTANANQTVQNTFNLQQVQNNLAFAQAFGKTATYAAGQIADQLENNNPAFAEGGVARDAMHAAVAAIGAALSGGNIAGAVGGSLGGDALQSLAQPIIDQAVSQVPPENQAALRNALNEVVAAAGGAAGGALAGGGSSGAIAGAGAASNNEVYNRQLDQSEKQVIKNLANGDPAEQHRLEAAACALVQCAAQYAPGTADYAKYSALQAEGAGYTSEQAKLQNYSSTFLSAGTYGGMVQQTSGASLFHYSASDAQADQRASQAATAALQPGLPTVTYTVGVGGTIVIGYGGSAGVGIYATPGSGKTQFDAGLYATYGTGYGFDPSLGGSVGFNKGSAADLRGVASNVNAAVSFADAGVGGSVTYSNGQATGASYGIGIKGVPSVAGGTTSVTNMTTCTFGISNARSGFTQALCK